MPTRASERKQMTGTLVKLNYEDLALFRYGNRVFAVGERCPHMGKLKLDAVFVRMMDKYPSTILKVTAFIQLNTKHNFFGR